MPDKITALLLAGYFFLRLFSLTGENPAVIKILDVGQGDAILVRSEEGKLILIDGGPDYEVDYHIQRETFFNRCRLDLLVLTHPHLDHLQGLNRLLSRCRIKNVAYNQIAYDSVAYKKWQELVDVPGVNTLAFKQGDLLKIDELTLVFLWPPDSSHPEKKINNTSVVLLLDSGEFEALFLGDLEVERLRRLDQGLISLYLDGRLELYKAGHHGSKNAYREELLEFLIPRICAVSVGEGNKFGHPHQETLDALQEVGCTIKRTDKDGTIEVLIN